ncbi:MAG: hypothetical protein HGA85_04675 [Nanoarchaeota archaeon]|nr:hypothetical protein [Nanoarchaeota archaeon]
MGDEKLLEGILCILGNAAYNEFETDGYFPQIALEGVDYIVKDGLMSHVVDKEGFIGMQYHTQTDVHFAIGYERSLPGQLQLRVLDTRPEDVVLQLVDIVEIELGQALKNVSPYSQPSPGRFTWNVPLEKMQAAYSE